MLDIFLLLFSFNLPRAFCGHTGRRCSFSASLGYDVFASCTAMRHSSFAVVRSFFLVPSGLGVFRLPDFVTGLLIDRLFSLTRFSGLFDVLLFFMSCPSYSVLFFGPYSTMLAIFSLRCFMLIAALQLLLLRGQSEAFVYRFFGIHRFSGLVLQLVRFDVIRRGTFYVQFLVDFVVPGATVGMNVVFWYAVVLCIHQRYH